MSWSGREYGTAAPVEVPDRDAAADDFIPIAQAFRQSAPTDPVWRDRGLQRGRDDEKREDTHRPHTLPRATPENRRLMFERARERDRFSRKLLRDPLVIFARHLAGTLNIPLDHVISSPQAEMIDPRRDIPPLDTDTVLFTGKDQVSLNDYVDAVREQQQQQQPVQPPFPEVRKPDDDPESFPDTPGSTVTSDVPPLAPSAKAQRRSPWQHSRADLGANVDQAVRRFRGVALPDNTDLGLDRLQRFMERDANYEWMTHWQAMGTAVLRSQFESATTLAHARVQLSCPGLADATVQDLIQHNDVVRTLFAHLTSYFVLENRFLGGSHRAFDRNHRRILAEIDGTVRRLAQFEFDPRASKFRPIAGGGLDHLTHHRNRHSASRLSQPYGSTVSLYTPRRHPTGARRLLTI